MRFSLVFVSFCCFTIGNTRREVSFQKFEKATFYSVMASGDTSDINKQLVILENSSINEKQGYQGALLMKKASFGKKAKEKLNLFKKGRIDLETALAANSANVEFHFLRLATEEHAPKIVKYNADIEKDKELVIKNFKMLSPSVQNAIRDYCKTSKVLHDEDL